MALRRTGPGRVHLVQTAGGPLGGDHLSLVVTVAEGCAVEVCAAAATVAQPGPVAEPTRWRVAASVGAGATLRWRPQPTVVCAGADYRSSLRADLAAGASLVAREEVVLGRHGECGGAYRGELVVTVAGRPLVVHESLLDGADAELSGPAGTGGHRVLGTLLVAGPGFLPTDLLAQSQRAAGVQLAPGARWAVLPLDGPGHLVLALGDTATEVSAILDRGEQCLLRAASLGAPSDDPAL